MFLQRVILKSLTTSNSFLSSRSALQIQPRPMFVSKNQLNNTKSKIEIKISGVLLLVTIVF